MICIGLVALLAGGLLGCDKPEGIRVYTVAKAPPMELGRSDAKDAAVDAQGPARSNGDPTQTSTATGSSTEKQTEMLGAITPQGKTTWFFKLTGPVDAVTEIKKPFAEFIKSVIFIDKGPQWKLPEGWKTEPGSQMRFATIRIPADSGPLEMSVIPLPTGEGKFEPYLLANVNRWRDQVGLGPLTEAQIADSREILKKELNGSPVWFTDFVGVNKGSAMGPPAGGQVAPRRDAAGAGNQARLPFDCQIPEAWTAGKVGQFQLAVFDIQDGDRQASVTVSTAGGDRAANINRWRGQVELDPLSPTELDQQARKIEVDGHDGMYIEAIGPESAKNRETILGVIVEAQGKQWFIKLKGQVDLAAREKDRFEKFVQSIKFR